MSSKSPVQPSSKKHKKSKRKSTGDVVPSTLVSTTEPSQSVPTVEGIDSSLPQKPSAGEEKKPKRTPKRKSVDVTLDSSISPENAGNLIAQKDKKSKSKLTETLISVPAPAPSVKADSSQSSTEKGKPAERADTPTMPIESSLVDHSTKPSAKRKERKSKAKSTVSIPDLSISIENPIKSSAEKVKKSKSKYEDAKLSTSMSSVDVLSAPSDNQTEQPTKKAKSLKRKSMEAAAVTSKYIENGDGAPLPTATEVETAATPLPKPKKRKMKVVGDEGPKERIPEEKVGETEPKKRTKRVKEDAPDRNVKESGTLPVSEDGTKTQLGDMPKTIPKATSAEPGSKSMSFNSEISKLQKVSKKTSKKSKVAGGKKRSPSPKSVAAPDESVDAVSDHDENLHLHGFSTDDDDSSDEEHDMDAEPSALDVGRLPTIVKDDSVVKQKLDKAKRQPTEDRGVLFLGRLPHGFYEDQLKAYFSQFGTVTRLRLSRNKKTGRSKHYAFLEFDSSSVAQIVADTMDNYLLMGHILRCKVIPKDEVHPELWIGVNRKWRKVPIDRLTRVEHNKPRTDDQQARAVKRLIKRQNERKRKLAEAGIKYDFEAVSYKRTKETGA